MTLKFKLVVRLYDFFSQLLGEDHRLTYYFFSFRHRMLEAHCLDDYEMLAMLNYPKSIRE